MTKEEMQEIQSIEKQIEAATILIQNTKYINAKQRFYIREVRDNLQSCLKQLQNGK